MNFNNNIDRLNQNAIDEFIHGDKILKIGKDFSGREYLVAKDKNFWTWLAIIVLRLNSYRIETVKNFLQDHKDEIDKLTVANLKVGQEFYKKLNGKIEKYNKRRPGIIPLETIDFKVNQAIQPILVGDPVLKVDPAPKAIDPPPKSNKSITSNSPEQIKEIKANLINFYVNQQARLMDLKDRLKTANPAERLRIEHAIIKIEQTDCHKAEIACDIQSTTKTSAITLANNMGKSVASLRGILLGQTYAKVILSDVPRILKHLKSIDSTKFGVTGDVLTRLKINSHTSLNQIAEQLAATKEEAADLIISLWGSAKQIEGDHCKEMQDFEVHIDQQVADNLKIDIKRIDRWLNDIELEKELVNRLTVLGKESSQPLDNPQELDLIDELLTMMKSKIIFFNQPFHLIKLQNILNRLNKDHPEFQIRKELIESLMEIISQRMIIITRQLAMRSLLDQWKNMKDLNNVVSKVFFDELRRNLNELDLNKGLIKAKLEYLERKSQKVISYLESHQFNLSSLNIQEVLSILPQSFVRIFLQLLTRSMKNECIDQIIKEIKLLSHQYQISVPQHDLSLFQQKLHQSTFFEFQNNQFILMESKKTRKNESSCICNIQDMIENSFLNDYSAKFNKLIHAFHNRNISVERSEAKLDRLGFKRALSKFKHVHERQLKRLKALENGESVIIPQYYHATNAQAACSIAKTGIEAIVATGGFGAFMSTKPEFHYGYAIIGLPKNVEFSSNCKTIYNNKISHLIDNPLQIWSGLINPIAINPRMTNLKQNFSLSIQKAISKGVDSLTGLTLEKKIEIEQRLKLNLNRSVVFRFEPANGMPSQQSGWSLNYREFDTRSRYDLFPAGKINKITTVSDFNNWVGQMINAAFNKAAIPVEQQSQLKADLLKNFSNDFKEAYYYGRKVNDHYFIDGKPMEKLKASLIAPDDEFKEIYEKEYERTIRGPNKKLKTISEVEKIFNEAGISRDLIDFIPLSEQLIERDLLIQVDAKIPKAWQDNMPTYSRIGISAMQ